MTTDQQENNIWQQQPDQQGYADPTFYQQAAQDQVHAGYGQHHVQQTYAGQPATERYAAPQPGQAYGHPAPQYPHGYGQTPYHQAQPEQPSYGGHNGSGYYGPTGGGAPSAPAGGGPGIGMVIAVTAIFGLFGMIPASRRAKKAQALGLSGGKYWKAFGITLAASTVLYITLANMGGGPQVDAAATPANTVKPAATAATAKPAAPVKPANTAKPPATVQAAAKPTQAGGGYAKLTNRTWLQIVKNPDGHAGEKVIIYGQIYQFDNFTGTDSFMAIAGPTKNESDSDTNTSFIGDAAMLADFVNDEVFRADAIVVGADNYDTQGGAHTTAPKLQIVSITKI
jgi:hypothetical protein